MREHHSLTPFATKKQITWYFYPQIHKFVVSKSFHVKKQKASNLEAIFASILQIVLSSAYVV